MKHVYNVTSRDGGRLLLPNTNFSIAEPPQVSLAECINMGHCGVNMVVGSGEIDLYKHKATSVYTRVPSCHGSSGSQYKTQS